MLKTCFKCEQEKSSSEFSINKTRKDGLNSQCRLCHKTYRKLHYETNRQKYINKAAKWNKEFCRWWKEYKKQFSCIDCGESHPACIQFHHHDSNKEENVAKLAINKCKKKLLEEVSKCTVLCANCHFKLHWRAR